MKQIAMFDNEKTEENTQITEGKTKKKNKTLTYPVSLRYADHWTTAQALREIIANAKDTGKSFEIYQTGKNYVIEDKGEGLKEKDFVFGETSKEQDQIGQFGEGLKMALLVFLKENKKMEIETAGFTVKPKVVNEFDSKILKLTFKPNDRTSGTKIIMQVTKKEMAEAQRLFIEYNTYLEKMEKDIYLPGKKVFINGLLTSEMNTLFSYNFQDKSMTNRDRNIVDSAKIEQNIKKRLQKLKTVKAIKEYLVNCQQNYREYNIDWKPDNKYLANWQKIVKKHFSDWCISTSPEADVVAKNAGYEIIKKASNYTERLLLCIGVPDSAKIYNKHRNKAIVNEKEKKVTYLISKEYGNDKTWNPVKAITELIANALDANADFNIRYSKKSGKASIVDKGSGIQKQHLVFGISDNKSSKDIGQFGEGLKMASLVMARNNRNFELTTKGFSYKARIEKDEEFNAELLVLYFNKKSIAQGTKIEFECTEKELEEAKDKFIHFKKYKKTVETPDYTVIMDEPNKLYINGMYSGKITSINSYNTHEKSAVNRDRMVVDYETTKNLIKKIYEKTKNEEVIKSYLENITDLKKVRECIEYQLNISPQNKDIWSKVAKKTLKNVAVSSGSAEDDVIAKYEGYEIVTGLNYSVIDLLQKLGVKSTIKIAEGKKLSGIFNNNRLVYPISEDYAEFWTPKDAIRDLIANALDADKNNKVKITHDEESDMCTIQDKGEGLNKKHLIFGVSNKENNNIGQFGEGLKIASLVMARNNRNFELITKGFSYKAQIEKDEEFGVNLLVFHLNKSKKRKGTKITFKCSKEELEETKAKFLNLSDGSKKKEIDPNIFNFPGKLYVVGVETEKINSIFSYNISNKALQNRDRDTLSYQDLIPEISFLVSKAESKVFYEKLLKEAKKCGAGSSKLEFHDNLDYRNIAITAKDKTMIKKLVNNIFGKNICLSRHPSADVAADYRGFRVIGNLPVPIEKLLLMVGIKYSDSVVEEDASLVKKTIKEKQLSDPEKNVLREARKKLRKAYKETKQKEDIERLMKKDLVLVTEFADQVRMRESGKTTLGLYKNNKIYIHVSQLKKVADFLGTFIHEYVHYKTGYHDLTPEFQYACNFETGFIASRL